MNRCIWERFADVHPMYHCAILVKWGFVVVTYPINRSVWRSVAACSKANNLLLCTDFEEGPDKGDQNFCR